MLDSDLMILDKKKKEIENGPGSHLCLEKNLNDVLQNNTLSSLAEDAKNTLNSKYEGLFEKCELLMKELKNFKISKVKLMKKLLQTRNTDGKM